MLLDRIANLSEEQAKALLQSLYDSLYYDAFLEEYADRPLYSGELAIDLDRILRSTEYHKSVPT